jgi:hypothetical protein
VRWTRRGVVPVPMPPGLGVVPALAPLRDHDGNVWIAAGARGVVRVNDGGASWCRGWDARVRGVATTLFEDREHNLWIGTSRGVERLRDGVFATYADVRATSFGATDGLAQDGVALPHLRMVQLARTQNRVASLADADRGDQQGLKGAIMTRTVFSLLLALFLSDAAVYAQGRPTVQTDNGPVVGRQAGGVRTFFGIPYAAAPVGDLRWRAPQPRVDWTTPREASAFGNVCVQPVTGMLEGEEEAQGKIVGNEDCLYLNVYARGNAAPGSRLPTMVWIHGGAFLFGAGSDYDASVLAQKHGVVVVTVNYRLGSLGFLALPTLKAEAEGESGNYGLMDQQAALRWVRNNIVAFGGDPGNVTVFGESAGGFSVCAQLASPAAAGLFHKAIIQSGPCTSPNNSGAATDSTKRNLDYAAKVGCKNGSLACLRKTDPKKLAV